MLKRPKYVSIDVAILTAKFFKISDIEKRLEWVSNFILALAGEAEDEYAAQVVKEAQIETYKEYLRKWKNVIVKNLSANGNKPTDEQIYNALVEEHGEEYLEAVELLSSKGGRPKKNGSARPVTDAPNGNAGENCQNTDAVSGNAPEETTTVRGELESANIRDENNSVTTKNQDGAGDAPHRKEGEECPMRGCVAISSQQLKSGTSSAPSTLSELANNVKNGEPKKMAFGIAKVIMLTADEALKLKELYKEDLPIAAQILENYIVNNSRKASKYKSHYMVMRQGGWVWQRVQEYKTQQARTATAEKNLESAKNRANYKPFEVRQREMIEGVMATLEDPPENLINFRAG